MLGGKHLYKDDINFGFHPAFMRVGEDVNIALLPLEKGAKPIKNHNGAHFAMTISKIDDFNCLKASLRKLLKEFNVNNDVDHSHNDVDFKDYGRQLSLFFSDPDNNILEFTHWVNK